MGSNSIITTWLTIFVPVIALNYLFLPSLSRPVNSNISSKSLDEYLYNCSLRSIPEWPHTGVVYNVSVPANLSGMELSVLRLRSSTLWNRGANISLSSIPPRIITVPFVKRVAIMYEEFGNLSSHYHVLSGYTLLTAVVGLAMYDASELGTRTTPRKLNIAQPGEPIRVKFSQVQNVPKDGNLQDMKCARFDLENEIVELSNVVRSNICSSHTLGHFTIVMPKTSQPPAESPAPAPAPGPTPLPYHGRKGGNKAAVWKWRFIIFAAGLSGLILVISCCVACTRMISSRKIRRLERGAEGSEALGTTWIGNSKMPSANMIRTQPDIFETDHH